MDLTLLSIWLGDPARRAAAKSLADAVSLYLMNERAFAFARDRLKDKYEPLVRPASYEFVVSSLRLMKSDFAEFFRDATDWTPGALSSHLRELSVSVKVVVA